jgi:simple sugar transport system permease protein
MTVADGKARTANVKGHEGDAKMKKLFEKNEFFVALTIIGLSLIIGAVNQAFFSLSNLFDILRGSVVMGIFAIGFLIVIVSGGIDLSFAAVAAFSMYITSKVLIGLNFQGSFLVALLVSAGIGLILGLINAVFISEFKLSTMIVTLGTQSMYQGFLLAFVGSAYIIDIPQGMIRFSKLALIRFTGADGTTISLHFAIILLVAVVIFSWFLLRYTMLGRGIYALGGAATAAARVGFNIRFIQYFIYGFVGFIAGMAGVVHVSLARMANPFDLVGTEMNVIAAVVLGGARITGGYGTIFGTLLGVCLVVIINNSLILLGVPSYWQQVVIGLLILIGIGIPTYQSKRNETRLSAAIL